jgi:predicted DsbA family dithiol-disulfide isomerase
MAVIEMLLTGSIIMAMQKKLTVEFVSDHVCPWCYVGKKRLEKAIAQCPDLDIEVAWRPFQLSPDMPREGRDRLEHYTQIFGEERAQQIMTSMKDTGLEEGIAFDYKPGARSPNTLSAHVLMLLAAEHDDVDASEVAEKLFHAHHVDCEDIGDPDVLVRIGREAGLDPELVSDAVSGNDVETRVSGMVRAAAEQGVSGVPFFIINGRYGISGAQPADTLAEAFEQISAANE